MLGFVKEFIDPSFEVFKYKRQVIDKIQASKYRPEKQEDS
jgi:hypothetical protein